MVKGEYRDNRDKDLRSGMPAHVRMYQVTRGFSLPSLAHRKVNRYVLSVTITERYINNIERCDN
jgi:hypothetical protein